MEYKKCGEGIAEHVKNELQEIFQPIWYNTPLIRNRTLGHEESTYQHRHRHSHFSDPSACHVHRHDRDNRSPRIRSRWPIRLAEQARNFESIKYFQNMRETEEPLFEDLNSQLCDDCHRGFCRRLKESNGDVQSFIDSEPPEDCPVDISNFSSWYESQTRARDCQSNLEFSGDELPPKATLIEPPLFFGPHYPPPTERRRKLRRLPRRRPDGKYLPGREESIDNLGTKCESTNMVEATSPEEPVCDQSVVTNNDNRRPIAFSLPGRNGSKLLLNPRQVEAGSQSKPKSSNTQNSTSPSQTRKPPQRISRLLQSAQGSEGIYCRGTKKEEIDPKKLSLSDQEIDRMILELDKTMNESPDIFAEKVGMTKIELVGIIKKLVIIRSEFLIPSENLKYKQRGVMAIEMENIFKTAIITKDEMKIQLIKKRCNYYFNKIIAAWLQKVERAN